MATATPKPWRLINDARNEHYRNQRHDGQVCRYVTSIYHDSDFVADIITEDSPAGDDNAALLAAAAHLFAACDMALAVVKGTDLEHAIVRTESVDVPLGDILRHALSKARGE